MSRLKMALIALLVLAASGGAALLSSQPASAAYMVASSDLIYLCGANNGIDRSTIGYYDKSYLSIGSQQLTSGSEITLPVGQNYIDVDFNVEVWFCKDRRTWLRVDRVSDFAARISGSSNNLFTPSSTQPRKLCSHTLPDNSISSKCTTRGASVQPSGYNGHHYMSGSPKYPGRLTIPSSWGDGQSRQICLRHPEPLSGQSVNYSTATSQSCYTLTLRREKSWNVSEQSAYIQRLNSSGVATGSQLGTSVTAQPGESYGFFQRWRNNGPDQTTRSINVGRQYTYPTSNSNNNSWRSISSGRSPGTIFSERIGSVTNIPQSAVGSSYTIRSSVQPRAWNNNGRLNGTQMRITVPYNYQLNPGVSVDGGSVREAGQPVVVQSMVENEGPTRSRSTAWRLTRAVYGPDDSVGSTSSTQNTRTPCQHLSGSEDCGAVENGSRVFSPGTTNMDEHDDDEMDDLPAGSRVCYVMSVRRPAHNSSTDTWGHSSIECVTIGKRPKVQVWGGDVKVNGRINTSRSAIGGRNYGSWGEYGVMSAGGNSMMASAGAFLKGAGSTSGLSELTFANTNNTTGGYGTVSRSLLRSQFETGNSVYGIQRSSSPISGTVQASSLGTGIHEVSGNELTISGGTVPRNRSVIIRPAEGVDDLRVTITGNIRLAEADTLAQIPQFIILADDITIRDSVRQVDAWLLADGVVNTCSRSGDLTIRTCDRRLDITGPTEANSIRMRRTAGSGSRTPVNRSAPAETFNLRSDASLWLNEQSRRQGTPTTVHVRELPPRF